uniref:Ig-like domain-containing protein n=1 Tax=Labrus bergylta TaxID=56723 RepID=A0A3Q3E5P1_9LABR
MTVETTAVFLETRRLQLALKSRKLESQEAEEGASITLRCELSKPGVSVEWKKGTQVLKSGEKYQMKQQASVNELLINKVLPDDSGDYSCVFGDQKTTASLKVKGRKKNYLKILLFEDFFLKDFHIHNYTMFFWRQDVIIQLFILSGQHLSVFV